MQAKKDAQFSSKHVVLSMFILRLFFSASSLMFFHLCVLLIVPGREVEPYHPPSRLFVMKANRH